MHIHHIVPKSKAGSGEFSNGIPVCLDCHAEIESTSNMGRSFTSDELRSYRNNWFKTVSERAEVLIRAAQTLTETGPLEALLAELDFNRIAVSGPSDETFPPLAVKQFERAIATNALAVLDKHTREWIQRTYVLIFSINFRFEELTRVDRIGGRGSQYAGVAEQQQKARISAVQLIPDAIHQLSNALGRDVSIARSAD